MKLAFNKVNFDRLIGTSPDARASASLIAGFSLIGITVTSVSLTLMFFFPGTIPAETDFASRAVGALPIIVSIISYALSRTRHFAIGGVLLVFGTFSSLLGQIILNPNIEIVRPVITYFYVIPLLCSLIFGWMLTLFTTLCCIIALLIARYFVDGMTTHDFTIQMLSIFAGAGLATFGAFLRQAAESELIIQRAKLTSSAKLSALGEMSAGMAHEINNPLAVIVGKTELLKSQIEADKIDKQHILNALEKIEAMGLRIGKIVSSLRTYSREGSLDPFQPTRVNQIVEDCLLLCEQRLKSKNIEFIVHNPNNQSKINCRHIQICQVLVNLLNNAHDAVLVSEDRRIELSVVEYEKNIEFAVTNSGKKIPADIQDKLFQPFFTTKEIGKGTGLGLSISMGIVENHGGKIWLDRKNERTRFVVRLPKNL